MNIDHYIAYHEAGHAFAMHQSKTFDIDCTVSSNTVYCVKPKGRKPQNLRSSPMATLEQSIIALSGIVAGKELLKRENALNFPLNGGETSDYTKYFGALQTLRIGHEAETIRNVVEKLLQNATVWAHVCQLATFLENSPKGRIPGDQLRRYLDPSLSGIGFNLPLRVKIKTKLFWVFRKRGTFDTRIPDGWLSPF